MATYTKETALYDTGAIAGDISDASETASNYLTDITGGGVYVHSADTSSDPTAATAKGVKITDKIDVIRNGESMAAFGEGTNGSDIRIGKIGQAGITLTPTQLKFLDNNGTEQTIITASSTGDYKIQNNATQQSFTIGDGFTMTDDRYGNSVKLKPYIDNGFAAANLYINTEKTWSGVNLLSDASAVNGQANLAVRDNVTSSRLSGVVASLNSTKCDVSLLAYHSSSNASSITLSSGSATGVSISSADGATLSMTNYFSFNKYLNTSSYVYAGAGYYTANAAYYYGRNSGGTNRILCGINGSNEYLFGYGSYNSSEGATYFDGNTIYIRSKNTINVTGTMATGIVRPKTASGYDLGTSDYPWDQLWMSGNVVRTTAPSAFSSTYSACWHKTDNNNYTIVRPSSSRKYKKDIENISDPYLDPHKLYDLRVVQFRYKEDDKDDPNNSKHNPTAIVAGFIAEEVGEIYPAGGIINENDEIDDWSPRVIIPPMLKLIQEQHQEIEQLKKEIMEIKTSL